MGWTCFAFFIGADCLVGSLLESLGEALGALVFACIYGRRAFMSIMRLSLCVYGENHLAYSGRVNDQRTAMKHATEHERVRTPLQSEEARAIEVNSIAQTL